MLKENFVKYIEKGICENWTHPALNDYRGESFTYAETGMIILRLHETFQKLGVQQGDKIALIGKNSARWAIVYFAAVSYGAVIVPVLPEFKPEDLQQLVNHSDSVILFCEENIYAQLQGETMPRIRCTLSLNNFNSLFFSNPSFEHIYSESSLKDVSHNDFSLPDVPNSTLAVISYTSGTTGSVKGVMLLNNSLAANVKFAQENMPLKTSDKIVSFLPFAHAFGCAFELLFPFSLGCSITILTKTPSPAVVLQAFGEVKPALILSVPLVIEKIYKNKIIPLIVKPKMKLLMRIPFVNTFIYKKMNASLSEAFGGKFAAVVVGGAPFSKEAERFFRKIKFKFTVGYGMTECGPLISYTPWDKFKPGSSGKLIDTLEAKINSTDPHRIPGEIMIRGEGVMVGYYKNEELTKEIIEEDGWMHTGDLGTMDPDGTIYIKGRSKTMLLSSNGQNIYPDEIESILNNMHAVSESIIIQRKDKLVALIYPDPDTVKLEGLSPEAINTLFTQHLQQLNNRIPAFMRVASFEIQKEEFLKTPKRSIKRYLYQ